jgi:hypothetical protein
MLKVFAVIAITVGFAENALGTLQGYCFHHVQAIMLTIDQYAESALGNREYFLNKPHSIGGKNDKIP